MGQLPQNVDFADEETMVLVGYEVVWGGCGLREDTVDSPEDHHTAPCPAAPADAAAVTQESS